MIYIWINVLPILAATVLGLAIGAAYRRLARSEGAASYGLLLLAALSEFWLASILAGAVLLAPDKAGPWVMTIGSAVVIWAGFVLPAVATTLRFRGASLRVTMGDCGYWLITMVTQAVLMKSIGLTLPS